MAPGLGADLCSPALLGIAPGLSAISCHGQGGMGSSKAQYQTRPDASLLGINDFSTLNPDFAPVRTDTDSGWCRGQFTSIGAVRHTSYPAISISCRFSMFGAEQAS